MANPGMKVIPIAPDVFRADDREEIAALAFEFWLAGGFRGGSPVDDLFRAARELHQRTAPAAKKQLPLFLVSKHNF